MASPQRPSAAIPTEAPAVAAIPTGIPVVKALTLHGAHFRVTAEYQDYLRDRIFPQETREWTNTVKKQQRSLLSNTCHQTLILIWKESSYVTSAELAAIGAERTFKSDGLNCHSLAKQMASSQHTIDAVHERVKLYVAAASAYGLVDRHEVHRNRHIIEGTLQLHSMFVALASQPTAHPLSFPPHPPRSPAPSPTA